MPTHNQSPAPASNEELAECRNFLVAEVTGYGVPEIGDEIALKWLDEDAALLAKFALRLRANTAMGGEQELSALRCDRERLKEIEGMMEPPFDDTPTTIRMREYLARLKSEIDLLENAVSYHKMNFIAETGRLHAIITDLETQISVLNINAKSATPSPATLSKEVPIWCVEAAKEIMAMNYPSGDAVTNVATIIKNHAPQS